MRLLRYCLPAAVLLGSLALLPAVASANWTGTYSITQPGSGYEQENNYNCSSNGPNFGEAWDSSNNYYNMWSDSQMPSFSLPGGTTLVGATLNGSVVEYNGYGGITTAGNYYVGFGAGEGTASNAGNLPGCSNIAAWGGDGTTVYLPGNTSQSVAFTIHAYHAVLAYVNGSVPSYLGRPVYMSAGGGADLQSSGAMSLQIQYAYQPTLNVNQVYSGNGTQVTVSWNPNGNGSDISYVLQREALSSAGVAQSWTTLYQGTGTSFTTSDQGCGYGYVYRVEAVGQDAATPWTTSSEWDEYPCSVSVSVPANVTNYINISWPEVTSATTYDVVWCQSSSCTQQSFTVSPGTTTSAQLTGLTPNTEYTVWGCATTNAWGCPVASAWTYAAVPTLSPNKNASGLAYDQQPLTWNANGNPPGTVYDLQQGTYAQSGSWQGGTVVYSGTGTSFTANQGAGGSYSYNVWAINAGYGTGTAASNGVPTQVASTPTLTPTGSSTATVSWATVAYMSQTGVVCEEPAGSAWVTIGTATGGAMSMPVTGLQPNTQYYCATYAVASNQGLQWWQGTNTAYTAANAPASGGLSNITETSMTANWSANGNPAGTQYYAVLQYFSGGSWLQESGWTTATSWTPTGLTPGTEYQINVEAENGSGQASAWTYVGGAYTVPTEPTLTGGDGGLGWSATSGRGYVTLSWPASTGATGYTLYVYDGGGYEAFDLGNATSWDSRNALIYPTDGSLYPNVASGSKSPPVLSHNAGGLHLRDLPNNLYCTTEPVGGYYCGGGGGNPQNYWFTAAAYNASGSSASVQVPGNSASSYYEPTLPLQTDPAAPVVTNFTLNNGGAYTYSSNVAYSLGAAEGTSGIAAYALSNDGATWTTTAVGGCSVGQVAPCQGTLSATGTWSLLPGPGSKTVWAKVESTAGIWSAATATTVYVNVDQTTPTVNVTLDGGAASTTSTSVTVGVSVTDTVAQQTSLTWQARYSTDGGATWSAWQAEGTAMTWSTPWTIPGGASGARSVYVQVQNNDQNLAQGAASILFVNPTQGSGTPSLSTSGTTKACTWQVNGSPVSATCVTSSQVSVPLTPPAGATQMRASLDDVTWGPWLGAASSLSMDLGSSPGAKTVWIQFQDAQNNLTDAGPLWYVFDPGAPTLSASWLGNASATDGTGAATLDLQASDAVGQPNQLTVTVTENGSQVYSGAFANSLPVTLTGTGYQVVQVAVSNLTGATTSTRLGIYVE